MPKPRDLPKLPKGWIWHPRSKVTRPGDYLATPQLTLEGPPNKNNCPGSSVGAPTITPIVERGVIYSCTLKKFSACCGIGHAVHFLYPSKPEVDKMALMLQAIEEQNCVANRTVSLLSLVLRNAWAKPAIEAMTERGWRQALEFSSMVWHRGEADNKVQVWYKDCTEMFLQMEAEDKLGLD